MREMLVYDETSPSCLRWAVDGYHNKYRKGDVAGATYSGKAGYYQIQINGKKYLTHRVVYFIVHGVWPEYVDHINGDKLDNRESNLRSVTHRTNMRNTTKAKGFYYHKQSKRFIAQISHDSVQYNKGSFDNILDARAAYLRAKRKEHYVIPGVGYPIN